MYNQNKIYKQTGQLRSKESGRQTCSSPVWQSPRTLGIERTLESTTTKAECTLESGCGVLYSTSYPGVACSRVRPTRAWLTLESMVTTVAMDSRVQKWRLLHWLRRMGIRVMNLRQRVRSVGIWIGFVKKQLPIPRTSACMLA